MMTIENPPQKIEFSSLGDDPRYLVNSALEVVYILRALMNQGELIAAYYGPEGRFILTTLLAVDPKTKTLILDCSTDDQANRKMLASNNLVCSGTHDKVHVQFTANHAEEVLFDGRPAFKLRLPETLFKLQRREYYRLTTPVSTPVSCTISTATGERVKLKVYDISIGGICVVGDTPEVRLEPGMVYQGCSINLPEAGSIIGNLEVRNAFEVTLHNDAKARRCGCMFVNLPASAQTTIQKYIIKLERERRNRLEGE